MSETGYPVCFDATHSVQMPTSMGNISGGQREFIPVLLGLLLLVVLMHFLVRCMIILQKQCLTQTVLHIKYLEKILMDM